MNRNTRAMILFLSFTLLTSIACSLVSQFSSSFPSQVGQIEEVSSEEIAEEIPVMEPEADAENSPPESVSETIGDGIVPPPQSSTPCANTFYPMLPGNQWVYDVSAEGESNQISLTVSAVDGNQATLNALDLGSGVTTEVTVECQDGTIINFPILLLGFLFGDVDGELNLEHKDGVYSPSYDTFVSKNWDHTWVSEYVASGTIEAVIDGDLVTGRLQESPLNMEWNTLGAGEAIFDGITTKAGEFPQAIKLEREAKLDFTAEVQESGQTVSLSAVLILKTNMWYEPNMGLLKQEIDQASARVYGVNFPIIMDGTLELVEFRSGE